MMQAFNLLILIFSIIHTGWVLNHIAIAPVKSWYHYNHSGFYKVLSQALFVSNLWFWQRFACSSFAKPGKHFLIETDDAAEEDVAKKEDYEIADIGGRP